MHSTSFIVHAKPGILQNDVVNLSDVYVADLTKTKGEVQVHIDNVPWELIDCTYQEPIQEFCAFYGIDYDLVNDIEMV